MSHSHAWHALARRSGQILDRQTVIASGLPLQAVDSEVRAGRLELMHPGVYVPTAVAADRSVSFRAALAAAGAGAVLSHRAAAARHGILEVSEEAPSSCWCRTAGGSSCGEPSSTEAGDGRSTT